MDKNIILIGMMGAGKSSVGKLLAEKISDFKFFDMDEFIVRKENMPITDIFSSKGEEYFRDIESGVVEEFSRQNNLVISTGGGIVKNPKNIQLLKQNGILFYLAASVDTLYNRVKNSSNRPLLNDSDIKLKLSILLHERENSYKISDYTIDTNGKALEEVVEEIVGLCKKYE